GEKSRLRMAQIMLTEAQLLLLDEPTNDLDLESLMALEQALDTFPGGIVLVSHDRYFMDRVCSQILSIEGHEYQFFSDYFQWEAWYQESQKKSVNFSLNDSRATTQVGDKAPPNRPSKKGLSYKEELEFNKMEANIQGKEKELKSLQEQIEKPEVQSDSQKVNEYYLELQKVQSEIDTLYSRWSELEEKKLKSF
ncbi:MAG: ABC-F family ATP-binding cassette domain-containing protein, partial [Bdellovibrionales bacterium]|nr:ABC-F family ATP-binding cassette domain-containing protein [Bdellovibrionales bacterium]